MRAILRCGGCGQTLTGAIEIASTKDPSTPDPMHEMAKPLSPIGRGYKSHLPIVWSDNVEYRPPLQFVPQYWLNPDDLLATIKDVADMLRLGGCCGRAGQDGPNQRCRACDATVGTLMDDCWTDRVFIPEPSLTTWTHE